MEENDLKCPECDGEMERGELVDNRDSVSGAQDWARNASGVWGIGKRGTIRIVSYRCLKCGFLKNYAYEPEKNGEKLPPPPYISHE